MVTRVWERRSTSPQARAAGAGAGGTTVPVVSASDARFSQLNPPVEYVTVQVRSPRKPPKRELKEQKGKPDADYLFPRNAVMRRRDNDRGLYPATWFAPHALPRESGFHTEVWAPHRHGMRASGVGSDAGIGVKANVLRGTWSCCRSIDPDAKGCQQAESHTRSLLKCRQCGVFFSQADSLKDQVIGQFNCSYHPEEPAPAPSTVKGKGGGDNVTPYSDAVFPCCGAVGYDNSKYHSHVVGNGKAGAGAAPPVWSWGCTRGYHEPAVPSVRGEALELAERAWKSRGAHRLRSEPGGSVFPGEWVLYVMERDVLAEEAAAAAERVARGRIYEPSAADIEEMRLAAVVRRQEADKERKLKEAAAAKPWQVFAKRARAAQRRQERAEAKAAEAEALTRALAADSDDGALSRARASKRGRKARTHRKHSRRKGKVGSRAQDAAVAPKSAETATAPDNAAAGELAGGDAELLVDGESPGDNGASDERGNLSDGDDAIGGPQGDADPATSSDTDSDISGGGSSDDSVVPTFVKSVGAIFGGAADQELRTSSVDSDADDGLDDLAAFGDDGESDGADRDCSSGVGPDDDALLIGSLAWTRGAEPFAAIRERDGDGGGEDGVAAAELMTPVAATPSVAAASPPLLESGDAVREHAWPDGHGDQMMDVEDVSHVAVAAAGSADGDAMADEASRAPEPPSSFAAVIGDVVPGTPESKTNDDAAIRATAPLPVTNVNADKLGAGSTAGVPPRPPPGPGGVTVFVGSAGAASSPGSAAADVQAAGGAFKSYGANTWTLRSAPPSLAATLALVPDDDGLALQLSPAAAYVRDAVDASTRVARVPDGRGVLTSTEGDGGGIDDGAAGRDDDDDAAGEPPAKQRRGAPRVASRVVVIDERDHVDTRATGDTSRGALPAPERPQTPKAVPADAGNDKAVTLSKDAPSSAPRDAALTPDADEKPAADPPAYTVGVGEATSSIKAKPEAHDGAKTSPRKRKKHKNQSRARRAAAAKAKKAMEAKEAAIAAQAKAEASAVAAVRVKARAAAKARARAVRRRKEREIADAERNSDDGGGTGAEGRRDGHRNQLAAEELAAELAEAKQAALRARRGSRTAKERLLESVNPPWRRMVRLTGVPKGVTPADIKRALRVEVTSVWPSVHGTPRPRSLSTLTILPWLLHAYKIDGADRRTPDNAAVRWRAAQEPRPWDPAPAVFQGHLDVMVHSPAPSMTFVTRDDGVWLAEIAFEADALDVVASGSIQLKDTNVPVAWALGHVVVRAESPDGGGMWLDADENDVTEDYAARIEARTGISNALLTGHLHFAGGELGPGLKIASHCSRCGSEARTEGTKTGKGCEYHPGEFARLVRVRQVYASKTIAIAREKQLPLMDTPGPLTALIGGEDIAAVSRVPRLMPLQHASLSELAPRMPPPQPARARNLLKGAVGAVALRNMLGAAAKAAAAGADGGPGAAAGDDAAPADVVDDGGTTQEIKPDGDLSLGPYPVRLPLPDPNPSTFGFLPKPQPRGAPGGPKVPKSEQLDQWEGIATGVPRERPPIDTRRVRMPLEYRPELTDAPKSAPFDMMWLHTRPSDQDERALSDPINALPIHLIPMFAEGPRPSPALGDVGAPPSDDESPIEWFKRIRRRKARGAGSAASRDVADATAEAAADAEIRRAARAASRAAAKRRRALRITKSPLTHAPETYDVPEYNATLAGMNKGLGLQWLLSARTMQAQAPGGGVMDVEEADAKEKEPLPFGHTCDHTCLGRAYHTRRLTVRNSSAMGIEIPTSAHFAEIDDRLVFDRGLSWGHRLYVDTRAAPGPATDSRGEDSTDGNSGGDAGSQADGRLGQRDPIVLKHTVRDPGVTRVVTTRLGGQHVHAHHGSQGAESCSEGGRVVFPPRSSLTVTLTAIDPEAMRGKRMPASIASQWRNGSRAFWAAVRAGATSVSAAAAAVPRVTGDRSTRPQPNSEPASDHAKTGGVAEVAQAVVSRLRREKAGIPIDGAPQHAMSPRSAQQLVRALGFAHATDDEALAVAKKQQARRRWASATAMASVAPAVLAPPETMKAVDERRIVWKESSAEASAAAAAKRLGENSTFRIQLASLAAKKKEKADADAALARSMSSAGPVERHGDGYHGHYARRIRLQKEKLQKRSFRESTQVKAARDSDLVRSKSMQPLGDKPAAQAMASPRPPRPEQSERTRVAFAADTHTHTVSDLGSTGVSLEPPAVDSSAGRTIALSDTRRPGSAHTGVVPEATLRPESGMRSRTKRTESLSSFESVASDDHGGAHDGYTSSEGSDSFADTGSEASDATVWTTDSRSSNVVAARAMYRNLATAELGAPPKRSVHDLGAVPTGAKQRSVPTSGSAARAQQRRASVGATERRPEFGGASGGRAADTLAGGSVSSDPLLARASVIDRANATDAYMRRRPASAQASRQRYDQRGRELAGRPAAAAAPRRLGAGGARDTHRAYDRAVHKELGASASDASKAASRRRAKERRRRGATAAATAHTGGRAGHAVPPAATDARNKPFDWAATLQAAAGTMASLEAMDGEFAYY